MTDIEKENHILVCDIKENDNIDSDYLVTEKRFGTTRRGDIFLNIIIADKSGEIEAKVWDNAEAMSELFSVGDIVRIKGMASVFKNQLQLKISEIVKVKAFSQFNDLTLFLEASDRPASDMLAELKKLLLTIKNRHLKKLCNLFFEDEQFIEKFKKWPGAKGIHHAYLGGLLEHVLSVCNLAKKVGEHYGEILDSDILLSGAFIHDIGKIRELSIDKNSIDYTDEGRLIGHVVLGLQFLDIKIGELKDFPNELKLKMEHIIASHHGELNFGSPKRPKFLEAVVIHFLDDLDAKVNGIFKFMIKDKNSGSWTDFNRLLERFFFKGECFENDSEIGEEDIDENKAYDNRQLSFLNK